MDLCRDVRHGVRTLRRSAAFTAVAVSTLAIGIGANTAIFSLADAVILRTLPVETPRDLVVLRQHGPSGDIFPFTSPAAAGLATTPDVLRGLAAFRPLPNTQITVNGETELAVAQAVSADYHEVLGVRALVGRTLAPGDRDPVAVISYRYWQQRFAGDPKVAGRSLDLQGRPFTIVGVTPPEFFGTQPGRHVDVTVPLDARLVTLGPNARWLYLIGRLQPGVSRARAEAALRVRWAQLAASGAVPPRPSLTLAVDGGAQGLNELRRQFALPLRILMTAVAAVLLVACANLAGLSFVRSSARQREIAVRCSLGAPRGRIVRQLVTESALLAAAGGAAGLAVARWTRDALLAMMSLGRSPIVVDVRLDARTFAFASAVTIATAVLCGLLPALSASRTDVLPGLKGSALAADGARTRWARAMITIQIALLVLLLASAGLFTRTLKNLRAVDAGFRDAQVLVVDVPVRPAAPRADTAALFDELYTRFGALPGVQSISVTMDTPPAGEMSMCAGIEVPGRPADGDDAPVVCQNFVGPRFFETMGIPVLAGRDFDAGDDARAPQRVIVSDGVARRYFAGGNPLGRQLTVGAATMRTRVVATIVGVVKDVRYTSLRADAPLIVYRPARQQSDAPARTFLIRTTFATADALAPLLRAEARAAAPALPPPSVARLSDRVAGALVEERVLAALASAIAALAAILAAIGVYSTAASSVSRRRREIGIRMALGALPRQVARMVIGEGLALAAAGLAIGIPAALAAALTARAVLAGLLFRLSPADPVVLFGASAAILGIASLAAYGPAHRASRIDPVAAIKDE